MEEEKAAAYYNELLGKGRNAALFKQGLGFGSNSTNAAPAKHGMINFVGAGNSTEADKELDQPRPTSKSADTTIAPAAKYGMINFVGPSKSAVAVEARKELEEPSSFSKPAGRDGDDQSRTSLSKKAPEDIRSGSRSHSEERDQRERSDNNDRSRSPSKEKRGRHRSRSREPRGSYPRDERRRSRSRSKDRNRRDRSGSISKRSRRSDGKERSRSPLRKRSRQDRYRSRSRSRDRGRRHYTDRYSRSRSRSRDRSQRYHRDRRSQSRSRSRESDRKRRNVKRSRSRQGSRRDYRESRGRSKSESPGRRGRDRGLDDRKDRSRSDRRKDTSRLSPSRSQKRIARRVERDQDWAKLIPGFDSMTPAEKVKAKMKLQLSQTVLWDTSITFKDNIGPKILWVGMGCVCTSVVKDAGKGVEEEWERFDFNKDAPLDGDAKQDYFGDGMGASTDTAQIDNLGGSHLFITEQARREARLQAAHEAAIFGARVVVDDKDVKRRPARRERESSDPRGVDDDGDEDSNDTAAAKVSGVVSEQIIVLQAGSSWQERIKKMRAAQAQDES